METKNGIIKLAVDLKLLQWLATFAELISTYKALMEVGNALTCCHNFKWTQIGSIHYYQLK